MSFRWPRSGYADDGGPEPAVFVAVGLVVFPPATHTAEVTVLVIGRAGGRRV